MIRNRLAATVIRAVAFSVLCWLALSAPAGAADKPSLTKKELKTLIATAKIPADHMKLARYFNEEADRLEAEAKEHEELAQEYRKNPSAMSMKTPMSPNSADHCLYFAKAARDAAKAARELASSHEGMAKGSK